ncbi:MAG: GDP-mannose 4,6-dehydratase [Candidatus Wallbacteria bacterium]|nr:GDP-mannose 4,6-dehydratase [Candidatus Wallbacteria bacterium]
MARALVTGITGFAGRHLARALGEDAHELFGLVRHAASPPGQPSPGSWSVPARDRAEDDAGFTPIVGDISERASLERAFLECRPDWIFHLAGRAFVPESWERPEEHLLVNLLGTLNVLEAARRAAAGARIVLAGSGEVYGFSVQSGVPVDEQTLCQPSTPYAVSKLAADLLGLDYHRRYGLQVVRLRLFNHTGPGQRADFVLPSFARQIALIETGAAPPRISVGDLDVERVFTDVRDVARAYVAAARGGQAGACYNVGRSPSYRVRELLGKLLARARVAIEIVVDPARLRPGQVRSIECDPRRFMGDTGWAPAVPIDRTLEDLLDHWRRQAAQGEEKDR